MRIIYLTSSSSRSGGARQAMYTAKALLERGHDLTFFVPDDCELLDVDRDMPWRFLPPGRRDWREAIERELTGISARFIVHAHHNKAVKLLSWWGLFWRRRGACTLGHRGVIFRPNNPLPYWSPGLDRFTVNSRTCADIVHRMGVSRRRIDVVYNGLLPERIRPTRTPAEVRAELGLPEGVLVAGSVSGDAPYKGIQVLLPALAAGLPPDAHAVLLGLNADKWRETIRELGLTDRVHLVHYTERVADYLQLFDFFILPSLQESMPNTVIEAVGSGLPVVASNVGATPELVQDNGLLYRPGDVRGLTRAIAAACSDRDRLKVWAAASLKHGAQFHMSHKITQLESIYGRLLTS